MYAFIIFDRPVRYAKHVYNLDEPVDNSTNSVTAHTIGKINLCKSLFST